jgi:hypothetical protein
MLLSDVQDGLLVIVKEECETCHTVLPALVELAREHSLTVAVQDQAGWPAELSPHDDSSLALSWALGTEVTPTLYQVTNGTATELTIGWDRKAWREITGMPQLGEELPPHRPGCGSMTQDPDTHARLTANDEGQKVFTSRILELGSEEDSHEAMFARGWSDGLPVVPPTPEKVRAMLAATHREPEDFVADIGPNIAPATVEKVAINAVLAGCKPEYFPVVLAAVEAVASDEYNMHGLAATTWYSGTMLVVNGPIADKIGMNGEFNAFGPGNRANATIGRAVNLVVQNVGGSLPGGVDRSMQGHPAKWTLCFAEREHDSPWTSLAAERGFDTDTSTVTAFACSGPAGVADQISRNPESLARSIATGLQQIWHPKLAMMFDAMVAIGPEHARVFAEAGWDKARVRTELLALTTRPGAEMVRGAGGIDEGIPIAMQDMDIPKFRPDGLWITHVGSGAGLWTGVFAGWVSGEKGSDMVTRAI